MSSIQADLFRLYADYPLLGGDRVYSGQVALRSVRGWHQPLTRKVRFTVDGRAPHEDMPRGQSLAVLEWGLNLVIALRYYRYLMLHSAVVERGGHGAMLLPAWPGHGKTTLCVALAHRGWRLLSDEFGLVRPGSTSLVPVPRPMPLKNESIDVIRSLVPGAVIGPSIPNTRKGTVAHVRPPGLHESYVNIRGNEAIMDHVRLVWASLWSAAALLYRRELGLDVSKSSMAVVIQQIVSGERSGVAFSRDPHNETHAVIEAVHGLNQGLVDGTVEPDRWHLDRKSGRIISHVPAARQTRALCARGVWLLTRSPLH